MAEGGGAGRGAERRRPGFVNRVRRAVVGRFARRG